MPQETEVWAEFSEFFQKGARGWELFPGAGKFHEG